MTINMKSSSTMKGLKLSNETKCQISIIEGQGMATKQDVVESAIYLLYSIMPNDRNDRKPLSLVVDKAIQIYQQSVSVEDTEKESSEGEKTSSEKD